MNRILLYKIYKPLCLCFLSPFPFCAQIFSCTLVLKINLITFTIPVVSSWTAGGRCYAVVDTAQISHPYLFYSVNCKYKKAGKGVVVSQ